MIQFSKDSWHYKLASRVGDFSECSSQDICTYSRCFIWAILVVLFIAILGLVILGVFGYPMVASVVALVMHVFHYPIPGWLWKTVSGIGIPIWVAVGLMITGVGVFKLVQFLRDRKYRNSDNYKPSAIKVMYQHWHEKTCAKIEIK